jgi:hypothetical protein
MREALPADRLPERREKNPMLTGRSALGKSFVLVRRS